MTVILFLQIAFSRPMWECSRTHLCVGTHSLRGHALSLYWDVLLSYWLLFWLVSVADSWSSICLWWDHRHSRNARCHVYAGESQLLLLLLSQSVRRWISSTRTITITTTTTISTLGYVPVFPSIHAGYRHLNSWMHCPSVLEAHTAKIYLQMGNVYVHIEELKLWFSI